MIGRKHEELPTAPLAYVPRGKIYILQDQSLERLGGIEAKYTSHRLESQARGGLWCSTCFLKFYLVVGTIFVLNCFFKFV